MIGAAGAIGGAIARAFAAAPCNLILSDVKAPDYIKSILSDDVCARFFPCDISCVNEIDRMYAALAESLEALHVVVNAAGIVSKGPSHAVDAAEWDRVLGTNLKAVFFSCQKALAMMVQQKYGRIINIGSVIGRNGGNARGWLNAQEPFASSNVAYAASKAGVHALTSFLAREHAQFGITVNAIAPGPIRTAMIENYPSSLVQQIPAQRLGEPDEVASAVLYLASDKAGFVNGITLDMNGGLYIG